MQLVCLLVLCLGKNNNTRKVICIPNNFLYVLRNSKNLDFMNGRECFTERGATAAASAHWRVGHFEPSHHPGEKIRAAYPLVVQNSPHLDPLRKWGNSTLFLAYSELWPHGGKTNGIREGSAMERCSIDLLRWGQREKIGSIDAWGVGGEQRNTKHKTTPKKNAVKEKFE